MRPLRLLGLISLAMIVAGGVMTALLVVDYHRKIDALYASSVADRAKLVSVGESPVGQSPEQIVGRRGLQGQPGQAGQAGADGAPGADGADGARGPAGPPGKPGPAGPAGADGESIPGPAGPSGPAGADGKDGADGRDGTIPAETRFIFPDSTVWTCRRDLDAAISAPVYNCAKL